MYLMKVYKLHVHLYSTLQASVFLKKKLPFVWLYDVRVLVYDGKIFLVTTTCSHSTRSVVGTAVPSTTRKSLKKNNTPSRVPVFLFVDACVYNNLYIYM